MVILISNKVYFRTESIPRVKKSYLIMTMGLISQEDVTILNVYASKYKKENRRKKHIYNYRWRFQQTSFNYQMIENSKNI